MNATLSGNFFPGASHESRHSTSYILITSNTSTLVFARSQLTTT